MNDAQTASNSVLSGSRRDFVLAASVATTLGSLSGGGAPAKAAQSGSTHAAATPAATAPPPKVTVAQGEAEGRWNGNVRAFLGLPYAAAPVGALRFQAPRPPASWVGVRKVNTPGASAPQIAVTFPRLDMKAIASPGWVRGGDYLTLNVWAPATAAALPVMVWIHGGGGVMGSKDLPVSDGSGFARSGVVSVAINYRLGIEGFLPIPGAPTNLALRDILAALAWVKANIAAFGGDPGNVTIFGESGGAMCVSALVASPLANGLFQRAIIQSGHGSSAFSIPTARRVVDKVASILKVTPNIQGIGSVDAEALLAAQGKVAQPGAVDLRDETGFDPGIGLGRFNAVYGDDVLPHPPLEALRLGTGKTVDLLVCTMAEEGNFWFIPTRLQWLIPSFAAKWLLGKIMAHADEALTAYGLGKRGQHGGAVLNRTLTDLGFRWPARQFAEAHQGVHHVAEFDWRSAACDGKLGACHGLDLPFVFDTLAVASGPRGIAGPNPPQALATRIHQLWASFARNGNLPWPAFDGKTRQVFQLSQARALTETIMPIGRFAPKL